MPTSLIPLGGGSSSSTVIAEDKLSRDGGVIVKRGPVAVRQNVDNGFALMRQHVAGTGQHRPAPSIGDYPQGLWIQAIGAESDGYGGGLHSGERVGDDGTGTYMNLERAREGVWVTQSWWWGLMSQSADAVGQVFFYADTEGWGSLARSYFTVRLTLATGELAIRADSGAYVVVGTVPVPGWNDNKYDRHYTSFTYFLGPSTATGLSFGQYGAFQIGSVVADLRTKGGGSANYDPSPIAQPGSSFSGGHNPGIGITTPVAGKRGGIVVYDFALTIGDTLA